MNILHVIPIKGWGGAEQIVYSLCKCAPKDKCIMHVVIDPDANSIQRERFAEVAIVHEVKFRNFGHLYNLFNVIELIKANKIDVVNVHGSKVMYLLGLIKAMCSCFKLVFFKHVLLKPKGKKLLAKLAYKYVDKVICVSSAVFNEQVQVFGQSDKFVKINNGIDVDKFNIDGNISNDVFTLGFVGRIAPEKGIEYLVDALKRLKEKGYIFKALIVGEANSKSEYTYERYLNKYINDSGLKEQLVRLGFIKDLSMVYRKLDLLVLPSIGREAFGMVLCEAMYFSVPVITTNTGGQTDVVTDGETGLVVNPKDTEALANAMIRIMDDKKLRNKLALNGKEQVLRNFTFDKYEQQIRNVYEN